MSIQIATILAFIASILPVVGQVVLLIEKLFPKAPGPVKKEAAIKVLKAVLPQPPPDLPDQDLVLGESINQSVASLNASGKLKHRPQKKV
jgi:hypothetical protein